ncbi:MAG: HNH endonuclease family protein [Actinomycetota bacterium]|jgi:hypothetical protein
MITAVIRNLGPDGSATGRRHPIARSTAALVTAAVVLIAMQGRNDRETAPGVATGSASTNGTTPTATTITSSASDPSAILAELRVAPEGPRTGYGRELFLHWIDADHDGCDTRDEVLIAESRTPVQMDRFGCKVLAGDWFSLYDAMTFDDPSDLDIDHVVSLAEAWDSGARRWGTRRREEYANDIDRPQTLRAVSATANRSKGDLDPHQWKPVREAAWCQYARDWIAVKVAWNLTADREEVDDLRLMLHTC